MQGWIDVSTTDNYGVLYLEITSSAQRRRQAPPAQRGEAKVVGDGGLEPPTSAMSTLRSNQLS